MKEIRIAIEQFDLEGYLVKTLEFCSRMGFGDSARAVESNILCVKDDFVDWELSEIERDVRKELLSGMTLFFPFSDSGPTWTYPFTDTPSVECVDGSAYRAPEDDDDDDGILIGDTDSLGFLVRNDERQLIINSAVLTFGGPGRNCYPDEDCALVDKAMSVFIGSFCI